ncbi:putative membrane protein [Achromobacter deleyi]|uniref:Putative membrane protein n=1 Tax=Achromobacter deleyi TaxID=1353891 RepID=A0A6S7AFW8_9BURK|nr:DUF2868 domain-containing protein [Achromobacter deleyi]CAB3730557.1 putative membrane protein [Achromobacter deleyi]CAB3885846.1 putative membrane protein [Achromobacter deleyi]CAB3887888.1 putative membrane protein [Achromobacter deleyi]
MPSPTSRDLSYSLDAPGQSPVRAHWLAELIRLREAHWGPLEDASVVRQVRQQDVPLPDRILARAQLLAQRENLIPLIDGWRRSALAVLAVLLLLALVSGVGVAAGALGDGTRPVNVLWALGALLGLHALTFLLWLASFLLRPAAMTPLGRLWLWATRKLARGPDGALVPQAFLNLMARAGALRGLFGAVSHGLWLAGLGAALATLLVLLSTASYRFIWATTLLAPDTFVWLTQAIGWLPSKLGFALPDAAMVRASDGAQALAADAQVQWSVWLIGVVVVYGILPRLAAWLACLAVARRAVRTLAIDPTLAGHAALRDRLDPPVQSTGIDRPVDPLHEPRVAPAAPLVLGGQPVLLGLELPADLPWPPAELPATIRDAGKLDTREQRHRVLDALAQAAASRLLIACDARQTPDRGTLALIAELAAHAGQTRVWLLAPANADTREPLWRERLAALGLAAGAILDSTGAPLAWLEHDHA